MISPAPLNAGVITRKRQRWIKNIINSLDIAVTDIPDSFYIGIRIYETKFKIIFNL